MKSKQTIRVTVEYSCRRKNYVAEYFAIGRRADSLQLFFVRVDEFFDRQNLRRTGAAYEEPRHPLYF